MGLYIVDDDLIEFINESIIIERLTDKNASKKIDFETDIEAITKELSPNGEKVMLLPTSSNKNYVKLISDIVDEILKVCSDIPGSDFYMLSFDKYFLLGLYLLLLKNKTDEVKNLILILSENIRLRSLLMGLSEGGSE